MKNTNGKYDTQPSMAMASKIKQQKPIYWKQVLVTTFAVYPLLLTADWFLKSVFPMQILRPEVAIFFTVVVVASLMVFPVMPFIMKHVGSWMHKETGILNIISSRKINPDASIKQNRLLDTKTLRLNKLNINVRYAELGDPKKPPLLLLHGVPENLQSWYAVAPLLAKKYRVLALDWPGFGGSDPLASPAEYTSLNFADTVVDFMDSLQIPQAVLMATDIALLPALLVGLEHPSRVSKLVVMDGIPFPRPQYSSWELKSFAKKGSILGKALVEWFPIVSAQVAYLKGFYRGHSIPAEVRQEFLADGRSKSNQEALLSYFHNFHIGQKYFEQRVQNLQIPVLVVWSKYDRFIDIQLAHEIVEKLPNAKLEIIDKTGHYVHMDSPQELVRVATKFLDEY